MSTRTDCRVAKIGVAYAAGHTAGQLPAKAACSCTFRVLQSRQLLYLKILLPWLCNDFCGLAGWLDWCWMTSGGCAWPWMWRGA